MSPGASTQARPTTFWTRDYLLGHCEGYSVCTPEAHVGFVEAVTLDPTTETAIALIVRESGDFGTTVFPIDDVADVRPKAEEIVLVGS